MRGDDVACWTSTFSSAKWNDEKRVSARGD